MAAESDCESDPSGQVAQTAVPGLKVPISVLVVHISFRVSGVRSMHRQFVTSCYLVVGFTVTLAVIPMIELEL